MSDAPLAGRYAIVRRLDSGGNALLFEARDLKVGRAVAIKTIAPVHQSTPEAIQRLEREGRIAASIAHPNVCAVTDIDRLDSGAPFLVLELLTGETLADRIEREGPLPPDRALRIAEQLLAGLSAAHGRGIIHRDIKPSNVFLVENGVPGDVLVKLIDFGTAQVPGMPTLDGATLTRTGLVVGTALYMSPEQVRGLRDFDARTDVYSVGAVIYEMLTGVRPFGDRPPKLVLEAIAFERPRALAAVAPGVPPHVARAVDLALSNDRMRRHADAAVLLRALRGGQDARPETGATQIVGPSNASRPPPPEPDSPDASGPRGVAAVDGNGDPTTLRTRRPPAEDWDLPTRQTAAPESVDVIFDPLTTAPGNKRKLKPPL